MTMSRVQYYARLSFLGATIVACATVSSYSTYQGLLAVLNPQFSLALAVCSGLILVTLPYAMFKLFDNIRFIPLRLVCLFVIPMSLFALSTVWSIVGLAKNEIFMHLVQENNTEFVDKYYPSEVTSRMDRVSQLLTNVEAFAERGKKNAMSGLYSGMAGQGDIARTMELLAEKTRTSSEQMVLVDNKVGDELVKVSGLVGTMQSLNNWDDRDEYLTVIREVNRTVKEIESTGFDIMLREARTSVDGAALNLKTIQEQNLKRDSSRGVVESEIKTLNAYGEEIDRLLENSTVSLPLVDVRRMDTPIVVLAFNNMFNIFNWWALCLGLDFAPFPLIYLLGVVRDPDEF